MCKQEATTNSPSTRNDKPNQAIWFDANYLKTTPGSLKMIFVAINLLAFISACAGNCNKNCISVLLFSAVSMFAFWISLILLTLYLFHLIEKYNFVPWNKVEVIYCFLFSLLYLIFSFFIILQGGFYAAASFFGFIATFLYSIDCYLNYLNLNLITLNTNSTSGLQSTTTNQVV